MSEPSENPPLGWVEFQLWGPLPALEAFADFMNELGAGGAVFSEAPSPVQQEMVTAFLPMVLADPEVIARVRARAARILEEFPDATGYLTITRVPDEDWGEKWRQDLKPVRLLPGLWIVPSFLPAPAEAQDEPMLRLDPGLAFGTGLHITTRQAVALLAQAIKAGARSVLDLGTGTGILAMAAARFGAERVVGLDIDPIALRVARENLLLNGLVDRIELRPGVSDPAMLLPDPPFDLIAANLFAEAIVGLLPFMSRHLTPGGHVALCGILTDREEPVTAALGSAGLTVVERIEEEEWVALFLKKTTGGK